jgi:DUF971 family protein
MLPVKIRISREHELLVQWDDQSETYIKLTNLRKNCPCAICNSTKEEQGASYIPIYSGDQISVDSVSQVGTYAISINWKDGHNTGIYDYSYLRKISKNREV